MSSLSTMRFLSRPLMLLAALSIGLALSCSDDDCLDDWSCGPGGWGGSGGAGAGGVGGSGGTTAGGGGQGGAALCGGCQEPTPLCDTSSSTCVACLGHGDCTDAANAKCEAGSCVACDDSAQCAGVTDVGVCDSGSCVQCALGDESACTAPNTCDLLAKQCVDVGPGSVLNCHACSNDTQCEAGYRCIEMDFEGSSHGYYCLREPPPTCEQPFFVPINKPSLSGAAATTYCGLEEDLATCEAVLALLDNWRCPSGTDGMCGPDQQPEVAVPGAICRQIFGADRCTYACAGAIQCPGISPQDTCGTGTQVPPGWCGG